MTLTQKILLNAVSSSISLLIVGAILQPSKWVLIAGGVASFTFLTVEDLVKDQPWKKK